MEYAGYVYHFIGESYEGESYYHPAGDWARWLTDTCPVGGDGEIRQQ